MPDQIRFWSVLPFHWEGGRIALARARLEGWRCLDDPDAAYAALNWYHSKTVPLLRKAHVSTALLTWSEGFPEACESRHRRQVAQYIRHLHAAGIQAAAAIPMTEIGDLDGFTANPEMQLMVACDHEGHPRIAAREKGGRAVRYKACLSQPAWRKHLRDCAVEAGEAGADAIAFDYTGGACGCDRCRQFYRKFTNDWCGRPMEMPPTAPDVDNAMARFYADQADQITTDIAQACTRACPQTYVYRTFRVDEPALPGAGCAVLATDGLFRPGFRTLTPGADPLAGNVRKETQCVSNAGILSLLAADRLKRLVRVSATPTPASRDSRDSSPAGPDELTLSMAEAWTFGANYAPSVRGHFLTDLYFNGRDAMRSLTAVRKYYSFFRQHPDIYESAASVAKTAVLVNNGFASASFLSWLASSGVIFDVRFIEGLSAEELDSYDLVLLPDYDGVIPALNADAWSALDTFLTSGGTVIICDSLAHSSRGRRLLASAPASDNPQIERVSFARLVRQQPDRLLEIIRRKEEKPLIQLSAPDGVVVRPTMGLDSDRRPGRFAMHILNYRVRAVSEFTVHLDLSRVALKTVKALSPDAPLELRHRRFGGLLEMKCGPLLTYAVISGSML